jgi:hypothetical protein
MEAKMPEVFCSCGLTMGVIVDGNLRKGWVVICSACQRSNRKASDEVTRLREKVRLLTLGAELGKKKNDLDFGDIFGDIFKVKK